MKSRQAVKSDIPILSELLQSFCSEYLNKSLCEESCLKGVSHFFDHPYLGRYYICESEGSVLGYSMVFFEWSDWRAGNMYYIEAAYTRPAHRRKGVFKSLFKAMHSDAYSENSAIRVIVTESFPVQALQSLGLHESHYRVFEIIH
jgi:L-amino acid N-acyltransferase YncA